MKKEPIILDRTEVTLFVIKEYESIEKKLHKKVLKLHKNQQWLIKGRILNMLFQNHYHLSFFVADKELGKREERDS